MNSGIKAVKAVVKVVVIGIILSGTAYAMDRVAIPNTAIQPISPIKPLDRLYPDTANSEPALVVNPYEGIEVATPAAVNPVYEQPQNPRENVSVEVIR
jgi:hypothetical protein